MLSICEITKVAPRGFLATSQRALLRVPRHPSPSGTWGAMPGRAPLLSLSRGPAWTVGRRVVAPGCAARRPFLNKDPLKAKPRLRMKTPGPGWVGQRRDGQSLVPGGWQPDTLHGPRATWEEEAEEAEGQGRLPEVLTPSPQSGQPRAGPTSPPQP